MVLDPKLLNGSLDTLCNSKEWGLRYGWPISQDGSPVNSKFSINHKGATEFDKEVQKHLIKEVQLGAVAGPFSKIPFKQPVAVSPLNSREKKNSLERCIIVNLSYPNGRAINEGILKNKYLGKDRPLHYPSVDNLIREVMKLGRYCLIFKRDF